MGIQSVVVKAVSTGTLCSQLETSAGVYNVTSLMPNIAINSLCFQTPVFAMVFVSGSSVPPTASPTVTSLKSPILPKAVVEKTKILEFKTVALLTFLVLISIFRFGPSLMDMYTKKNAPVSDHLYSILVVLNDEENAVLENIRHADIAFYRELNYDQRQHSGWMMNTSGEIFEKRQEVQFFDIYGLLGKVVNDGIQLQAAPGEAFSRSSGLQIGMIIQTRPADGWVSKKNGNKEKPLSAVSNAVLVSYLDGYSVAPIKAKKCGQSSDVLQQLPLCYSKNNSIYPSIAEADAMDNISDIETSCGSYKSRKAPSITDFDTTDTDISQLSARKHDSVSSPVNTDSKYKVMTHSNHLLWLKSQAKVNAHLPNDQMLTSRSLDLNQSIRSSFPHSQDHMKKSRPSTQDTIKPSSFTNNGQRWNNRNQKFSNNSTIHPGNYWDDKAISNRLNKRYEKNFTASDTFSQEEEKYEKSRDNTEEEKDDNYKIEKEEEKEL